MAISTIYPNGQAEIDVPATESIAIANYGGGIAKIYYLIQNPNRPDAWQFQQTLNNTTVTLGAFATATKVKIESRNSTVTYEVATTPSTALGDASTLGGNSSSYYAADSEVVHKTGSETISGTKKFSTSPHLSNNIYFRGLDTGASAKTLIGVNSSDVAFIGATALPLNIASNGTMTYNSAALASGSIDTTASQTITVVDGLITSIV